ncbi:MAG: hypothetical protein MJ179_01580 [Treponema sp.]|nr:hypothetical protein [Treponema sp.]
MKLLKNIICSAILIAAGVNGFSQTNNVKKIVPAQYYDQLMKDGQVEIIHEEGANDYVLLPNTVYNDKINGNRVVKGSKNFPFVFEGLYYVSKEELKKQSNSSDTEIDMNDVSRVLRSISKMQGMQYYSNTHNKYKTLYKKAYTIAGPDSKTAVADKTEGSAEGKTIYCLQDDASFGVTRYKLDYSQKTDVMYAVFNNIDSIGVGPVTGINKEQLKINVLVIDCKDSILLYLSTDANANRVIGIKSLITDSMVARMNAVHEWFLKQF